MKRSRSYFAILAVPREEERPIVRNQALEQSREQAAGRQQGSLSRGISEFRLANIELLSPLKKGWSLRRVSMAVVSR